MRAFERLQMVVVPAGHPGGRREKLEVARRQRGGPVGARQRLEGVRPLLVARSARGRDRAEPDPSERRSVASCVSDRLMRSALRIWRALAGR